MSVRKRTWTTSTGEVKEKWVVDYRDQSGARHIQTFARKKDADAYRATVAVDVRAGTHTAPSASITLAQAAEAWITYVELEGRERSTVEGYRQQVRRHIAPRIGREKLSALTTPRVNAFRDDVLAHTSRAMARKILTSLKSILRDAQRRGTVAQNVASAVTIGVDKRHKPRVDIPRTRSGA